MPTGGRKPTSASLGELLEELLKAGVDFILVGGLAAVIQGAPVTTMGCGRCSQPVNREYCQTTCLFKSG